MKITDIPTLQSPLHTMRVKLQHMLGDELSSKDEKVITEYNVTSIVTSWELVEHYYKHLVQRYPEFKALPKYMFEFSGEDDLGVRSLSVGGCTYSIRYYFKTIEDRSVHVPYHFNIYKDGRDITDDLEEIIEMGCVHGTAEYDIALAML